MGFKDAKAKKSPTATRRKRTALLEAFGHRGDFKTRQATSDFRRPAFYGTALEGNPLPNHIEDWDY